MASYTKKTDSKGEVFYKVQVTDGRGRKVTKNWRPEPGWSARTIQNKLDQFAASLKNDLESGALKTKQELDEEKRLAELEAAKLKTLRQYAIGVYMATKELEFSENARSSYQGFLDKHILPAMGDFLMVDISSAMLTKFFRDFQKKGYSHATVTKLYNICNGIFTMALLDDSIQINPMQKVVRPKPGKSDKPIEEESEAYTVDELRHILECLNREPLKWQVYINLLADSGMRRGEACGLQWQDINFKAGTVTIRRNLQYTPQGRCL